MKITDIPAPPGEHKRRKRVGRGPGSGRGKTCGRGIKGQGARSGGSTPPGFEGGQMPFIRCLPKRGFNQRRFATRWQVVNLSALARCAGGAPITPEQLRRAGLIHGMDRPVKILGEGELTAAVQVHAHAFSASATKKIQAAGGTITVLSR